MSSKGGTSRRTEQFRPRRRDGEGGNRRALWVCDAAVLLVLAVAGACGVRQAVPDGARGQPHARSAGGAGDLMSTADRSRLQAIAARRRGAQPGDGYRIGPDDLLVVRIPGLSNAAGLTTSNLLDGDGSAPLPEPDTGRFRGGMRVGPSGEVSLPLLGALQVQGRTARELERDIAARLVAVDAPPPQEVSVLVAEYRSGAVAVMGSVERPGLYPLTRPGATL